MVSLSTLRLATAVKVIACGSYISLATFCAPFGFCPSSATQVGVTEGTPLPSFDAHL